MNILLVTPFRLTSTGGVSIVVKMLYQQFRKQGHHVSILVPGESNRVIPVFEVKDVSLHGVYLRLPFIKQAFLRGFVAFWVFLPFTLYQLHRFLEVKQIDIVAIQYPLPWMIYFALLHRFCSWRLVLTLHGSDVHHLRRLSWIDRYLVKLLLCTSDRVTAVSESLLKQIQLVFPKLTINPCVVPNGAPVDMDVVHSPIELGHDLPQKYILTVGRLLHGKGIDVLIHALKIARDRGHVMNLVAVGEGAERPNLVRLAKETGLSEHIHFVGDQSHERTLTFFNNCLFFVLASRREGLPLVVIEAMASKKAVIATKVGGVPEIIKERCTGLLVEPEDPRSLAAALIELYKDSKLRHTLACHGRQQVLQNYSWEAIGAQYLNIFQELHNRIGEC